jgi:hypothetical protein
MHSGHQSQPWCWVTASCRDTGAIAVNGLVLSGSHPVLTTANIQNLQNGAAAAALGQARKKGLCRSTWQHHPAQRANVARRQPLLKQKPAICQQALC